MTRHLASELEYYNILGPLVFNVFLQDPFLFTISNTNLVNYADDNTPFAMGSSEWAAESLSLWFYFNCMKVNPDKFHLLLSNKKIQQVDICNEKLSSTCSKKLLGVKIDNKAYFWRTCRGTVQKSLSKSQYTGKNFIFNFSYCPLV